MSDLKISESSDSPLLTDLTHWIEGYEIFSKIGTGGAADVYLGKDATGSLVAIKFMLPPDQLELYDADHPTIKLPITPELISAHFDWNGISIGAKKEFEIGKILHHPYLMEVKDFVTPRIDGEIYNFLILEFLDGKNFTEIKKGDLTPLQAKKYALDLLEVLLYCYHMGYLYLDLFPRNIMLTKDGVLKLIDLEGFTKFNEREEGPIYYKLLIKCIQEILRLGDRQIKNKDLENHPSNFYDLLQRLQIILNNIS